MQLRRLLRPRRGEPAAWVPVAAAVLFAAVEIALGLLVGGVLAWPRAEALLFFFFRPWLLLIAALALARWLRRARALFYALALGLAGFSESLLLLSLGGDPWLEMVRGWAAGALAAAVIDVIVQLGARRGCLGQIGAAAAVVLLLLVPGAQRPYDMLALGPTASRASAERPNLLLMSALPLVWGEGGPFDPESRPAAAYQALEAEFQVRPIDYLDPASLGGARLMLLAQPRALAPAELAALDSWVRRGGRLVVLADPDLVWPSPLPLGDVRRPPPASLLSPLLDHWGLRLEAAPAREVRIAYLRDGPRPRRLTLDAPGRWQATGTACRVAELDYLAVCAIGAGRAFLVADADLLRDGLWAAPVARGTERHLRRADNPFVLADWLDRLAAVDRERAARPVFWRRPGANRAWPLLLAALPILAALGLAAALRRRRA